jgi:hypothetical protein
LKTSFLKRRRGGFSQFNKTVKRPNFSQEKKTSFETMPTISFIVFFYVPPRRFFRRPAGVFVVKNDAAARKNRLKVIRRQVSKDVRKKFINKKVRICASINS